MTALIVACALLLPATGIAVYYLVLTLIGLQRKSYRPEEIAVPQWSNRFAILIPAHDEEILLPRCLGSIPNSPNVRVIVVADNCTDNTAKTARNLGAEVLERFNHSRIGKGYALAHGVPAALAHRPDAVLILDADCELAPGTLEAFDAALAGGCLAIQAPLNVRKAGGSESEYIAAVGAEVDRAVHRGMRRFGCSVPLRGTGMLFRRELLETHPWSMHGLAEDAEFAAVLRRAGVRVDLLDGGTIFTEAPARSGDLLQQRRRWRAALTVPGLGLSNAILTSKPLILIQLILTAVLVPWLPIPDWLRALPIVPVAITLGVYLRAMLAVGFHWPGIGSIALVGKLAGVTFAGFWDRESTWKRTVRR